MKPKRTININLRQFFYLFDSDEQWINLYNIIDKTVLFEGQIKKVPKELYDRRIILLESQIQGEFNDYLGIWIATENEDKIYDEYNEEEDEDGDNHVLRYEEYDEDVENDEDDDYEECMYTDVYEDYD